MLNESKTTKLANLLKTLRTENGLKQEFVAAQLNITRSTYSYYESGKTEPSRVSLGILAKLFGVSVEYFIFDDDHDLNFYDSSSQKENAQPTNMGNLTNEEREIIALYRLAKPQVKRKASTMLLSEMDKRIVQKKEENK